MPDDCLFCDISNGRIPATIVYQDDQIVAFNDVNPQAPTHVLVIPRTHIATLNDLSGDHDGIVGEMVRRAALIARDLGHAENGVSDSPQLQRRMPDRRSFTSTCICSPGGA